MPIKRRRSYAKRRSSSVPNRVTRSGIRRVVRKFKNRVFRKRVKSVIHAVAETKHISVRNTKIPYILDVNTPTISSNMWILNPCQPTEVAPFGGIQGPLIGSQDGQREGNSITVKRAFLNMVIYPEGFDENYNNSIRPLNGRLWFFRTKRNQQTPPTSAQLCGTLGNFFQDTTGMSGFAGNLSDNLMRLNSDLYTYLGHKDFKLGFSAYNGTGSNTQPMDQYYHNNDYKMNCIFKMNITKYLPKKFTWDDAGVPTHPYTFCVIQVVKADGSSSDFSQLPCRVMYEMGWHYKDI